MSSQALMNDNGEHAMNIKTGVKIGYPGGSYTQSCENISYDPTSGLLRAECEDSSGSSFSTSVVVTPNYDDIVNCNGYLVMNECTGWEW